MGGCTPKNCTLGNDELTMVARAIDVGPLVRVEVDFSSRDDGDVPIPWTRCENDRILVNGEEAKETVKDDRTEYSVRFDVDPPRTITVELDRAEQDEVTASVTRPEAFEILEPETSAVLSRSEDIVLTWAPPLEDAQMQVELMEEIGGGRCIVTEDVEHDYKGVGGVRVEDKGRWTIPAGVFTNDGESECQARYVLSRFNQGEYPSELAEGGFIEAQVLRMRLFESVP